MVLSQLPVGMQPEGLNMFLYMNYLLLHLAVLFYIEYVFARLGRRLTSPMPPQN